MSWNLFGVNRPFGRCELLIFGSCIYKTQGSNALRVEFGAYLGGGRRFCHLFSKVKLLDIKLKMILNLATFSYKSHP